IASISQLRTAPEPVVAAARLGIVETGGDETAAAEPQPERRERAADPVVGRDGPADLAVEARSGLVRAIDTEVAFDAEDNVPSDARFRDEPQLVVLPMAVLDAAADGHVGRGEILRRLAAHGEPRGEEPAVPGRFVLRRRDRAGGRR